MILDVEAAPGHKLPDRDAMPEHKLKEVKIGSIKSETKVKIEQKKENLENNDSNHVETYV